MTPESQTLPLAAAVAAAAFAWGRIGGQNPSDPSLPLALFCLLVKHSLTEERDSVTHSACIYVRNDPISAKGAFPLLKSKVPKVCVSQGPLSFGLEMFFPLRSCFRARLNLCTSFCSPQSGMAPFFLLFPSQILATGILLSVSLCLSSLAQLGGRSPSGGDSAS